MLAQFVPKLLIADLSAPGATAGQVRTEDCEFACVLADLAGFTALSETLAKIGPDGEERIEVTLNTCFGQSLAAVEAFGGDVLNFAGDSFTALFPCGPNRDLDTATAHAVAASLRAVAAIDAMAPVEGHRLRLRVGVSAGKATRFDVGGVDNRFNHLAVGAAIQDLQRAGEIAQAGQVVLSPLAKLNVIATCELEAAAEGHAIAQAISETVHPPMPELAVSPDGLDAALRCYVADEALTSLEKGESAAAELRSVTSLFINLRQDELHTRAAQDRVRDAVAASQDALRRYGGGVHKVSTDEKGVLVVAVFGLPPHSHENNAARGARAAMEAHDRLEMINMPHGIGVTTGRAWCGIIGNAWRREYTVIAPIVNQAARLMQHAQSDVYVDDATVHAALGFVHFKPVQNVRAKGVSQMLPAYRPLRRASIGIRERVVTRLSRPSEIVGRKQELRQLETLLHSLVFEAKSGVVVLRGDSGIGKSALLTSLIASAEAQGVQVVTGGGDSLDVHTAFHAWRDMVYRLLDVNVTAAEPARREQTLAKLAFWRVDPADAALLNPVLDLQCEEPKRIAELGGNVRRARTVDYVCEIFGQVTHGAPALLVIDDVHWFDSASWEVLDQLQRRSQQLLVALTWRSNEAVQHPALKRLQALPDTLNLELGPLGRQALESLVCSRLNAQSVPREVLDLVASRSEGNPFVAEEMTFVLRDAGAVRQEGDKAVVAEDVLAQVQFPSTVQGLVTARLDRLPAAEQPTVKYAAVIGRSFSLATLSGVHPLKLEPKEIVHHLEHLDELRLVEREGEDTWSFRHAVTREAAYQLLPFHARQKVHLSIADWYEQNLREVGTSALPMLAWHYSYAGERGRSLQWFAKAGEHALSKGANREAIHFFAEARENYDRSSPEERRHISQAQRANWASRLGEARMGLGDLAGAQEALAEALQRMGERVPDKLAARGGRLLSEALRQIWHMLRRPVVERNDLAAEVARAWALIGEICYFETDIAGWALASLVAINRAETAGNVAIAARAYGGLANLAGTLRLRGVMRRYLRLARMSQDPSALMAADWADGVWRLTFGDFAGAREVLSHGVQLGERSGSHYELGIGITIVGYLQLCTEPTSVALSTLRQGLTSARDRGNAQHESWALTLMVPVLLARNALEEAERCVELAETKLPTSDPLSVPIFHSVKALSRWRSGRRADAKKAADEALVAFSQAPPAGYIYLPGLTALAAVAGAEMALAQGDKAWADKVALAALKLTKGFALLFPFARARRDLLAAELAEAAGRKGAAAGLFKSAAAKAKAAGLPWDEGRAMAGLGRVKGDPQAAATGKALLEKCEDSGPLGPVPLLG